MDTPTAAKTASVGNPRTFVQPVVLSLGLEQVGFVRRGDVRSLRFLNSTETRALPAGIDRFIARFLAWRM